MLRRFRRSPIGKKRTFCRYSLLVLLAVTVAAGPWREVDRVALIVGNRPVPLSEVRAYYWLHTGRAWPNVPTEAVEPVVIRMGQMERLYESRRQYQDTRLAERWTRLAIQFLANSGFPGLDPAGTGKVAPSLGMVRSVLVRELVVMRLVQAQRMIAEDGAVTLEDLVEQEAPDIRLTNYLF